MRNKVYNLFSFIKSVETFIINYHYKVKELLIYMLDSIGFKNKVNSLYSQCFGLYSTAFVIQTL